MDNQDRQSLEHPPLNAEALVGAVARALEEWRRPEHRPGIDPEEWGLGGELRTHIMKGDACWRRLKRSKSPTYVLRTVLKSLGYEKYSHRQPGQRRIYAHEWRRFDLLAIDAPENWDGDCWKGRFRTSLCLELENDIQKFELTMRGMLDLRASLHCGVFYAPENYELRLDKLPIGVAHANVKNGARQPLAEWKPPWNRGQWSVPVIGNEQLLAIFLSGEEPRVIGARCYRPADQVFDVPLPRQATP